MPTGDALEDDCLGLVRDVDERHAADEKREALGRLDVHDDLGVRSRRPRQDDGEVVLRWFVKL